MLSVDKCFPVEYRLYRSNRAFEHGVIGLFRGQSLHPDAGAAQNIHDAAFRASCQPQKLIADSRNQRKQEEADSEAHQNLDDAGIAVINHKAVHD